MNGQRIAQTILIGAGATICLIAVLLFINRYFYSWLGVAANKVSLCKHKKIMVAGDNGYPVRLTSLLDLEKMNDSMSSHPNYKILYWKNHLEIARNFGNVRYALKFDNHLNERYGSVTGLNANNFPRSNNPAGEKYDVPNYVIEKNVNEMVDDLPLTEAQKMEIRRKVICRCEWDMHFWL